MASLIIRPAVQKQMDDERRDEEYRRMVFTHPDWGDMSPQMKLGLILMLILGIGPFVLQRLILLLDEREDRARKTTHDPR